MNFAALYGPGRKIFSFEFFLPRAPREIGPLLETVRDLKALDPSYVTITYRAGPEGRKSVETAGAIQRETGIPTACHLAGLTHSKAEIRALLDRLQSLGIGNLIALRGDRPSGGAGPGGAAIELPYARDLVSLVRERGGFHMGVAGYPETHPEAESPEADIRRLAEKVRAGGEWVLTQLFFSPALYFGFVRRARKAGIGVPIVPGVMPITNVHQIERFSTLCAASIPADLEKSLKASGGGQESVARTGIDYAVRQCSALLAGGAPGIHFYTLNDSRAALEIFSRLKSEEVHALREAPEIG